MEHNVRELCRVGLTGLCVNAFHGNATVVGTAWALAIYDTCHRSMTDGETPMLAQQRAGAVGTRTAKSHHAPVNMSKSKAIVTQEPHDARVLPIRTGLRPLYNDSAASGPGCAGDILHGLPQVLVEATMVV